MRFLDKCKYSRPKISLLEATTTLASVLSYQRRVPPALGIDGVLAVGYAAPPALGIDGVLVVGYAAPPGLGIDGVLVVGCGAPPVELYLSIIDILPLL